MKHDFHNDTSSLARPKAAPKYDAKHLWSAQAQLALCTPEDALPAGKAGAWLPHSKTSLHHAMIFKTGFTLIELMIATALFGLAMAGAIGVFSMCQKMWHATSLSMQANREASFAISRLVYGIGSNNGLRTASSISVSNDMKGMWTGTDHVYPPAPGDPAHFLNPGLPDGSWRITCSNIFNGTRWIDFNKTASNIVLWIDPPPSAPNRETRQLICNYVSDAVVSTNASGVNIQLTLLRKEGRFTSTNSLSTFVLMRNKE